MEQEILEMVPKPRLVQQTIILMTGALKLMALKTRYFRLMHGGHDADVLLRYLGRKGSKRT